MSEFFEIADPQLVEFMARHNALLERVTVLERAAERAMERIQNTEYGEAHKALYEAVNA